MVQYYNGSKPKKTRGVLVESNMPSQASEAKF
jgi:hypothetical protein